MAEQATRQGRTLIGVVSSDKMDKTVVVQVTRRVLQKRYKKYIVHRTAYKAHDERNEYRTGDKVQIVEARPMSAQKRWRVNRLIERPDLA